MKMNKNSYDFGQCKMCNKYTQLKNGLCITCNDKELPDILKDLFRKKDETDE